MKYLIPLLILGVTQTFSNYRPNIIVILADDFGYSDIAAYRKASGVTGEPILPTPHLDKLIESGMRFTDNHSGAFVCTPTRYGLLTGRYS